MELGEIVGLQPFAAASAFLFYAIAVMSIFSKSVRRRLGVHFAPPLTPGRPHFAPLDTLRGFAATFVALGHAWYFTYPVFAETQLTFAWVQYGAKAVPMFCVLSGFLIYRSVIRIETNTDLTGYATARFFRVYPLYLVSSLLAFAIGQVNLDNGYTNDVAFFVSELFMFRAIDFPFYANPVTWSLYVEVLFYIFLPIFVAAVGRQRMIWVALLFLVGSTVADPAVTREFSLWKYFFFGIIASEITLRWKQPINVRCAYAALLVGFGLLVFDHQTPQYDVFEKLGFWAENPSRYTFTLGIACFMILIGLSRETIVSKALSVAPLRFIGIISYSVFILHLFYVALLYPDISFYGAPPTALFQAMPRMPSWYLPMVVLPGLFLWAAVAYLLIEKPMIQFGKKRIAHQKKSAKKVPVVAD
jgi:peptidoglycan/LPS O-acetylase OafA/YrhL